MMPFGHKVFGFIMLRAPLQEDRAWESFRLLRRCSCSIHKNRSVRLLLLVAEANHASGQSDGDGIIRHGLGDNGTGADNTVFAYIGHDDGTIADPGVGADCDTRPDARLLANWHVKSV